MSDSFRFDEKLSRNFEKLKCQKTWKFAFFSDARDLFSFDVSQVLGSRNFFDTRCLNYRYVIIIIYIMYLFFI